MTKTGFSRTFLFVSAFLLTGFAAAPEAAAERTLGPTLDRSPQMSLPADRARPGFSSPRPDEPRRLAQADCSSAAAEAAAESGGQVLSVSSRQQGGRTVCVVTVLVPGEDGGRPRKQTITIPQ